jgi:predicted dehydrogenase
VPGAAPVYRRRAVDKAAQKADKPGMSQRDTLSRRDFLRRSRNATLGATLGAVLPNIFLNQTKAATGENPSELIRIGFIGVGGQGNSNLGALMKYAVAVCDVDSKHLATTKARVEKANKRPCAAFGDYRKLLEDKSIDAVLIATPDHWHALPAMDACEAGKDVYCEKPLTLTIEEGQKLVKVVRRTNRIFQTGSQQRSDPKFRKACELVRSGYIGKVKRVLVGIPRVNYADRAKPLTVPDGEPPPELDYNFWLGPAPWRPYNVNRVHYLFRFFWDYSGGQMTNFGAHHLDIAQWGLGMDESGPVSAEAKARFQKDNLYETPEWSDVTYEYANGVIVKCGQDYKGGARFEGEKGTIFVARGNIESEPEELVQQPLKDTDVHLYASREHHQNWLECIKSRKLPICDVAIGHRSATVCHLGNIAIRTAKKVQWDPAKQEIVGDAGLAKWVGKPYRAPWKLPAA